MAEHLTGEPDNQQIRVAKPFPEADLARARADETAELLKRVPPLTGIRLKKALSLLVKK